MSAPTDGTPAQDDTPPHGETTDPHTDIQLSERQKLDARNADILAALDAGTTYREIVERYRVSRATISALAKTRAELEKGTIANLMKLKGIAMLDTWADAAMSGAKMGKHAPAKDWLLHAGLVEPLQDAAPQAKVTLIIGTPDRPILAEHPQILEAEVVSAKQDDGE